MNYHNTIFFIVSLSCIASYPDFIDLEATAQDIVVTTKRIILPEYPHAFNPSIVRWRNQIVMSFRVIPNVYNPYHSRFGLVFLNEKFEPCSKPQLLDMPAKHNYLDDARLITWNNKLYLIYSNNPNNKLTKAFRMHIAQLSYKHTTFAVKYAECIDSFDGCNPQRREKNWVPFVYANELMLAYSIMPHMILYPLRGTGHCETFAWSENNIHWNWGHIWGGTPALLDGKEYLAFFHSSKQMASKHSHGIKTRHYFIGAYTFSAQPPFELTAMSTQPIIAKQFYSGASYKPYWNPVNVVFPCGYIMDDKYIWISYGRQDHELWIAQLDKKKLYKSMKKISRDR